METSTTHGKLVLSEDFAMDFDIEAIGAALNHLDQHLVSRFLAIELKRRRQRNHRYSLRALARDLSISPGDLSKVMRGLKFLSTETVAKMTQTLHLSREQSRALLASAAMARLREKKLW